MSSNRIEVRPESKNERSRRHQAYLARAILLFILVALLTLLVVVITTKIDFIAAIGSVIGVVAFYALLIWAAMHLD